MRKNQNFESVGEGIKKSGLLVTEGLGICPIHNCELIGAGRPVWSWPNGTQKVLKDKQWVYPQELGRWYTPKVCPACFGEKADRLLVSKGAMPEYTGKVDKSFLPKEIDYVKELKKHTEVDVYKDTVMHYDYYDETSVVQKQILLKLLKNKVATQINIVFVDSAKYVELRKNRFMNDEEKQRYLKMKHRVEKSDYIVVDSLADYNDKDEEAIHNLMLLAKESARFLVFTIAESAYRLETMPSKLRFRLDRADIRTLVNLEN